MRKVEGRRELGGSASCAIFLGENPSSLPIITLIDGMNNWYICVQNANFNAAHFSAQYSYTVFGGQYSALESSRARHPYPYHSTKLSKQSGARIRQNMIALLRVNSPPPL